MPIVVEKFLTRNDISESDHIDLIKTYADADEMLWQTVVPDATSPQAFLANCFDNGGILYVARFNAKLIAAAIVDQHSQLKALCVRSVTRRRGVAKQFVVDLAKKHGPVHALVKSSEAHLVDLFVKGEFVENHEQSTKDCLVFERY